MRQDERTRTRRTSRANKLQCLACGRARDQWEAEVAANALCPNSRKRDHAISLYIIPQAYNWVQHSVSGQCPQFPRRFSRHPHAQYAVDVGRALQLNSHNIACGKREWVKPFARVRAVALPVPISEHAVITEIPRLMRPVFGPFSECFRGNTHAEHATSAALAELHSPPDHAAPSTYAPFAARPCNVIKGSSRDGEAIGREDDIGR